MLLTCVLLPALELTAPAAEKAPSKAAAAQSFSQHCAGCHGRSGTGNTFPGLLMFAPNLTRPAWQAKNTDAQIGAVIAKGHRMMPAFEKKLSGAEIAGLVAYIRQLKQP